MAQEPSPAFQFYPGDWLGDSNVIAMRAVARGGYIHLLCVCWRDCSLPVDDRELASLAGMTRAEWKRHGPRIRACFQKVGERLRHKRLDAERTKQHRFQRERSRAGRLGNERRWGLHREAVAEPSQSDSKPVANHRFSSSSSLSVRTTPLPPTGGFGTFWHAYPRKTAKLAALKAWNRLAPPVDLQGVILEAVTRAAASPDWQKDGGRFVPYPATWLNGRRWEDEQPRGTNSGPGESWREACARDHGGTCENVQAHRLRRAKEDA